MRKIQDKIEKKTNSFIEDSLRVLEDNTKILERKVEERETFKTRIKASADMSRSLLENGNDEEVVRSYQSVVYEAVDSKCDGENLQPDPHLSPEEIETMLFSEIKDLAEIKGTLYIRELKTPPPPSTK